MLVRVIMAMTLMLFIFQGLTALLSTYLIEEQGFGPVTAVGLFVLLSVRGTVFQVTAGRASGLFGIRRVLLVVATLGLLTMVALPVVEGC